MAINTPKSISREEKYLDKIGGNDEVVVPYPISREEKYMYRAAGYTDRPIPDYPIGRNEKYWAKIVENGGGSSTLIEKNITENGVYNASDDNADGYSSVEVNCPDPGEYNGIFKSSSPSFSVNTGLRKIIVPDGVTEILTNGFYNLTDLTEVILPNTLTNSCILFHYLK
jgi:hypothetical protein